MIVFAVVIINDVATAAGMITLIIFLVVEVLVAIIVISISSNTKCQNSMHITKYSYRLYVSTNNNN